MTPDLLLIGLSLLTWGLGEGAFFIFQPIYLQELGADPVQIGLLGGRVAMTVATFRRLPCGPDWTEAAAGCRLVDGTLSASFMALATHCPFCHRPVLYGLTPSWLHHQQLHHRCTEISPWTGDHPDIRHVIPARGWSIDRRVYRGHFGCVTFIFRV
jgi:hypothetical protein